MQLVSFCTFLVLLLTMSSVGISTNGVNAQGGITQVVTTVASLNSGVSATTTAAQEPGELYPGVPNVSCPFTWQGEPRYCYECRWCPFRASTCCEMEDEVQVLSSINVSGSADWDCFITIMHFQQCGKCAPNARDYLQNRTLSYLKDAVATIRPCRAACGYIYQQCKSSSTLRGEAVVGTATTEDEFCADAPTVSTPESPCYNSAFGVMKGSGLLAVLASALVLFLASMVV